MAPDPAPLREPRRTGTGRVALVANPSAELYGSDRMMLETVRGLVADGWRVVVAASQDGPLVPELEAAGARVEIVAVPVVRRANMSPRGFAQLLRDAGRGLRPMLALLRRERPDVLYVSTLTIPAWIALARLRRIPVLAHVHEAEGHTPRPVRLALAAPTALADHVVFNSRQSALVGALPVPGWSRRHSIVLNGVAGPTSAPTAPREQLDVARLVCVGRLSLRKGIDLAVDAVSLLRERGHAVTLDVVGAVFAGNEAYEESLREQVDRLGLADVVTLRGFQSPVWPWLERADIALVPSRLDESFGNVLVEAVLAARPVVTADHTGLTEARAGRRAVVGVRRDDAGALADGIEAVLRDWPAYRERALADAPAALQAFAPERYQQQIAQTIARVAGVAHRG